MATPYCRGYYAILKPQYAEEFIKSFQFSLVATLSHFWVSQGKKGLCAKQKSSRISLMNSSWPALWKLYTSLHSKFIFRKSTHSKFIHHPYSVEAAVSSTEILLFSVE